MITTYQKHTTADPFRETHSLVDDVWVHVDAPSHDEAAQLTEHYGLDSNVVRDVYDQNELPRTERSHDNLYVFLRPAVRSKHGEVMTSPFLAVVTPSAFITISMSRAMTAQEIVQAAKNRAVRSSDRAAMLMLTLHATSTQYQELIAHTGNYIQDIRRKLQNHEVGNRDFVHFVTIEDNLNEYDLCLRHTLAVADRLKDNTLGLFSDSEIEELDDLKLYLHQLLSAVASHSQSIDSIRNAYSTIANNTLNQRMKTLTVFTVLIALPNVFYGMYGMNIALPFQDAPWAYAAIVLFTAMLILAVYWVARRTRLF